MRKLQTLKVVNLICQRSLVPIVNKPTRVIKNNTTLIDYIIKNSFIDQENLTGILKHIADDFLTFIVSVKHRLDSGDKKVTIRKRIINAARFKNSEIFCLKWVGGIGTQYLTPTMPMNISLKFSQVYMILHSLSKLSRLNEKLCNILGSPKTF